MQCDRCEHRVEFISKTRESALSEARGGEPIYAPRPRYECGDTTCSINSCYMYSPVRPVVLVKASGDRRPVAGVPAILAARMEAVGVLGDEGMPEAVMGVDATTHDTIIRFVAPKDLLDKLSKHGAEDAPDRPRRPEGLEPQARGESIEDYVDRMLKELSKEEKAPAKKAAKQKAAKTKKGAK